MLRKIFKTNYNLLRGAEDIADKIIFLRQANTELTISQLKKKFESIKKLANGVDSKLSVEQEFLDKQAIEVFSIVDCVIKKLKGYWLHKVQLIGAAIIHQGDIAEMKTGEGKTITATLPAILNSILGKGVHIVTVNDYLAERDAKEMGEIYKALGVSVGCVTKNTKHSKKMEYSYDVTYITNSELGFDYLRDNMVFSIDAKVQRKLSFAIIDEVDSILIDEARTPLIISGGKAATNEIYISANKAIKKLKVGEDFEIDAESKTVSLTSSGIEKIEKFFKIKNLYQLKNSELTHRVHNALQANSIFTREVEYTVRKNKIELIDVFTGRILEGRAYSNGLHQAIQAKEGLEITPETLIQATITYQNLFRLYRKLSGMTGTAKTEEEEFHKIYNLRVFDIPTNAPVIRDDLVDSIYSTKEHKWNGVLEQIKKIHSKNQPILVGTRSVEDSEKLSKKLLKEKIPHTVLNAKNHAREADIIEEAGFLKSITISTNMAGRGTDIKLGEGVKETGGLYVIGTERHEARRIDNQLRGRSGRQGDIGASKFIISLEDEIMVRAASPRLRKFFNAKNPNKLESKTLSRVIKGSQKRMEGLNFDARKSIIDYDNVLNQQRLIVYGQRDIFLTDQNLLNNILVFYFETIATTLVNSEEFKIGEKLDVSLLFDYLKKNIFDSSYLKISEIKGMSEKEIILYIEDKMIDKFNDIYHNWNDNAINLELRKILLSFLDREWQKHINILQKIRSTIEYRQYAQKKPIQIYTEEAGKLLEITRNNVYENTIRYILRHKAIKKQDKPTRKPKLK